MFGWCPSYGGSRACILVHYSMDNSKIDKRRSGWKNYKVRLEALTVRGGLDKLDSETLYSIAMHFSTLWLLFFICSATAKDYSNDLTYFNNFPIRACGADEPPMPRDRVTRLKSLLTSLNQVVDGELSRDIPKGVRSPAFNAMFTTDTNRQAVNRMFQAIRAGRKVKTPTGRESVSFACINGDDDDAYTKDLFQRICPDPRAGSAATVGPNIYLCPQLWDQGNIFAQVACPKVVDGKFAPNDGSLGSFPLFGALLHELTHTYGASLQPEVYTIQDAYDLSPAKQILNPSNYVIYFHCKFCSAAHICRDRTLVVTYIS